MLLMPVFNDITLFCSYLTFSYFSASFLMGRNHVLLILMSPLSSTASALHRVDIKVLLEEWMVNEWMDGDSWFN